MPLFYYQSRADNSRNGQCPACVHPIRDSQSERVLECNYVKIVTVREIKTEASSLKDFFLGEERTMEIGPW